MTTGAETPNDKVDANMADPGFEPSKGQLSRPILASSHTQQKLHSNSIMNSLTGIYFHRLQML